MEKDILYPLRRVHGKMHEWKIHVWPVVKQRVKKPEAVFLIMTPEHDNLGDQALALSETRMLSKLGIDYIELTGEKLDDIRRLGWLKVMNGRTIFFNGGGYLGTLWFYSEQKLRDILKENKRSTICILPNTIYYENDDWGKREREKSVHLYGAHKKLFLYAREKISFEQMRELYKNVKLMPDMVLTMDESQGQRERKGCLLCLRGDCEKTRTEEEEREVLRQAKTIFADDVGYTDMRAGYTVLPDDRERELSKKFKQFKEAQLVITDRLHGMIFCAITATPCIVLESKSHKIRGCYEWIRNLDYICFADSPSQIGQVYDRMCLKGMKYDNAHLRDYFAELEDDILRFANKAKKKHR